MTTASNAAPSRLRRRLLTALFILLGLGLLLVVAVIVWRTSLASKIDARLKAIRADGFPASAAELDQWYTTVPEKENAALIYLQATDVMAPRDSTEEADFNGQLRRLPRSAPLPPELKSRLAEKVAAQRAALELLHQAAALAGSRYPIDLNKGLMSDLSHLSKIKSAAQVLQQEALLNLENGRPDTAGLSLHASLRVGQSLANEPVLISQLVRIATDTLSTISLQRVLSRAALPDAQLTNLMTDLAKADDSQFSVRALAGERATAVRYFRMSGKDIATMQAEPADDGAALQIPRGMGLVRATGFFERDLLFYLDTMATNVLAAGLPPPQSIEVSKVASQRVIVAKKRFYILSGLLLPALDKAITRFAEDSARLRAAQVALAIERHRLTHQNQLPASLNALVPAYLKSVPVDPFDGEPIRYRRLPKGYVVYSIGSDGADDGGTEKPPGKTTKDDGYDLTFTVER